MIDFAFDEASRKLTCRFVGRMDSGMSIQAEGVLKTQLAGYAAPGQDALPAEMRVVFDLEKVDFMASAFLRLCLATAKKTAKGGFSIVNSSPQLKKIFKIAGFEAMFPIA